MNFLSKSKTIVNKLIVTGIGRSLISSNRGRTILLYLILALLFFVNQGLSVIHYVPGDFELIQSAIDVSESGDTVLIGLGDWYEQLMIENTGITVASRFIFTHDLLDIEETRIIGGFEERPFTINSVDPDTVNLVGLTIREGEGNGVNVPGGLQAENSFVVLRHLIFEENRAGWGGCARLFNCISLTENCTFKDSHAEHTGGGVNYVEGYAEIVGCNFIGNTSSWSSGGLLTEDMSAVIVDNLFYNNFGWLAAGGARVNHGQRVVVKGNRFIHNFSGWGAGLFAVADTLLVMNNLFEDNYTTEADHRSGSGSGLDIIPDCQFVGVNANSFVDNQAERSGAGATISVNALVSRNIFRNNRAPLSSAFLTTTVNGVAAQVRLRQNLFINNGMPADSPNVWYRGAVSAAWDNAAILQVNDFRSNEISAAGLHNGRGTLELTNNFWGHPTGPYHEAQNPMGLGDTVTADSPVIPFSVIPFTDFYPPSNFNLLSPSDNDTNLTLPIQFSWEMSFDPDEGDSVRYLIEFSEDSLFNISKNYLVSELPEFEIYRLLFEQWHYWRVVAVDLQWQRTYSNQVHALYATNIQIAPAPFSLLEPENGSEFPDSALTFSWEEALDSSLRDSVTYELQFSHSFDFQNPTLYQVGVDTQLEVNQLPEHENVLYWRVLARDTGGNSTLCSQPFSLNENSINHKYNEIPSEWDVSSVFPNPFNSYTQIKIAVPENDSVSIHVFDITGSIVTTLYKGDVMPGYFSVVWDAEVASGIYFVQLQTKRDNYTKKIALVR
ncbi:T9SS type A sorting domain-containing protein [bacterium]|nr:T9SS type A sorting domain-containing protein [bacterium]